MNILFCVSKFPSVSETFIRDQIVGLIDRGHKIHIYVNKKQDVSDSIALKGLAKYNLNDKVICDSDFIDKNKMMRLLNFILIFCKVLFKSKYKKSYLKSLDCFKYGYKSKSLLLFFKLHFLESNNITIIHAHFGYNGEKATIFRELGYPIKLVTTFHGNDIRLGLKNNAAYNNLKKYGTILISISEYNYNNLIKIGFNYNKIRSVHNGVDTKFYKQLNNKNNINNTIKILTVARLVEEKNIHLALKGIAAILKKHVNLNITYVIIGSGILKSQLHSYSEELEISQNIKFLGALNSEQVKNTMLESDFFLLTSRKEALPTVILEAGACSLPIIASNVGSIKDMFLNDEYIFESENLKDLVLKLEKMISERLKFPKIGKQNRKFIVDNYSLHSHLNMINSVYEE